MVHEAQGYLRHHYDNVVGQIPQQSLSFCARNMAVWQYLPLNLLVVVLKNGSVVQLI